VGVGALLSIMAVVSGLLVGSGNASRLLDLGDGRGWITDNSAGGASGVSGVSVGSATTDWRSVGGGTVASVVAGADGLVWAQVDVGGGQFEWRRVGKDEAMAVSQRGGKDSQVVVSGGGVSWLVDAARSTVRLLTSGGSSKARAVEPSIRSNRGPGGVAPVAGVDGEGRLVVVTVSSVVVFGRSGDAFKELARFDVPERVSNVVTVGERVVLVSRTGGAALVLDGVRPGKRLSLGVSGKETKVPGRSTGSVLWVLDPTSGRVLGTHLDGRRVGELPLPDTGDAKWSDPVVVGDVVMVSAQVGSGVRLWRGAPRAGFREVGLGVLGDIGSCSASCPELFESGGRLWVNQSTSPDVGVVDTAGVVRRISKGRPSATGEGEGSGAGAAPDQGAKVADTAFERAGVPPVPYRKPTVNAPLGSGQMPGANPTNPTTGQPGDPTTNQTIGTTPDTITPIDGSPEKPPATPEQHGDAPCARAPDVVGSHVEPPAQPADVSASATSSGDGRGVITVSWKAGVGAGVTCSFFVLVGEVSAGQVRAFGPTDLTATFDVPVGDYTVEVSAGNNNPVNSPSVKLSVKVDGPPMTQPDPQPTPGANVVDGPCRFEWRQGNTQLTSYVEVRLLSRKCTSITSRFVWRGPTYSYRTDRCDLNATGASPAFAIGYSNTENWIPVANGPTACEVVGPSNDWYRTSVTNTLGGLPESACFVSSAADAPGSMTHPIGPRPGPRLGDVWSPDPCRDEYPDADLNWDGIVGCFDLNHLRSVYGQTSQYFDWRRTADVNRDNAVTLIDLAILINQYNGGDGGVCESEDP